MSAVPDLYLVERWTPAARLRSSLARLARNRTVVVGVAGAALVVTFATMLATDNGPGRIGTIWFVPWVALLATQLGPVGGALSGLAATALYFVSAEVVADADDPLAVALRLVPLVAVGVAAGLSSRRISSDALELQSTTALQATLLDSTVDGICLTDAAGDIVLANAPLQRFAIELGLPLHGTVAERLLALADRTTEPARFAQRMRDLRRDHAASEDEFELAESGRVFRGYTAPVARRDGTVVGRIWTLREVTAERRLERLRDAFVNAVSHELRTPLTSMTGFLELLGDEEHALGPAGRRYLEVIRRKTAKLFEAAARLGGVLAGVAPELEEGLASYGAHVGSAFQLVDDVLDYSGDAATIGKSLGDDLAEGKPTLPLIHAMRTGTAQQSALVRSAIVDGGRERFPGVLDAIRASGALDYARSVAQREAGLAQRAIEGLPHSKYKDSLLELSTFSVTRRS